MIALRAEVQIAAPAARIWELLTDQAAYARWNPMLRWGAGTFTTGSRLELTVTLPGISPFTLHPTLLALVPERELTWRHCLPVPGLLSWTQAIVIEPLSAEAQQVSQRVSLGGLLAPLYALALSKMIRHGLDESGAALRKWAEKEVQCHRC